MPVAADSALAPSRPLMITAPPSATNRRATSLPIPEAPPVTIAILSWKRVSVLLLFYLSIGSLGPKTLGTFPRQPLRRRPIGARRRTSGGGPGVSRRGDAGRRQTLARWSNQRIKVSKAKALQHRALHWPG